MTHENTTVKAHVKQMLRKAKAIRAAERAVLEHAANGFAGEMGFETFLGANVAKVLRKLASSR